MKIFEPLEWTKEEIVKALLNDLNTVFTVYFKPNINQYIKKIPENVIEWL